MLHECPWLNARLRLVPGALLFELPAARDLLEISGRGPPAAPRSEAAEGRVFPQLARSLRVSRDCRRRDTHDGQCQRSAPLRERDESGLGLGAAMYLPCAENGGAVQPNPINSPI